MRWNSLTSSQILDRSGWCCGVGQNVILFSRTSTCGFVRGNCDKFITAWPVWLAKLSRSRGSWLEFLNSSAWSLIFSRVFFRVDRSSALLGLKVEGLPCCHSLCLWDFSSGPQLFSCPWGRFSGIDVPGLGLRLCTSYPGWLTSLPSPWELRLVSAVYLKLWSQPWWPSTVLPCIQLEWTVGFSWLWWQCQPPSLDVRISHDVRW